MVQNLIDTTHREIILRSLFKVHSLTAQSYRQDATKDLAIHHHILWACCVEQLGRAGVTINAHTRHVVPVVSRSSTMLVR